MAIDSDIRDQAYQFFIQEAPELLQLIEEELLTLRTERSTAKIHNMMRAAHSIKGGAASVELETIKTLAHSLEDIFKGLHNEELEIDPAVESLLLEAYDCLRIPLMEQITTGQCDTDKAMATAEPVFARIEEQIGSFLREAELPSSVELGVDIALSIFEVDVAQGLERLSTVLSQPQGQEIVGELRAQAEVFSGIAELLNLPGFGAIATCALEAIEAHPHQALQITQLALADFEASRQTVLAGDRTQGGSPSRALAQLAGWAEASTPEPDEVTPAGNLFAQVGIDELSAFIESQFNNGDAEFKPAIPSLDDVFGSFGVDSEPANIEVELLETITVEAQVAIPELTVEDAIPSLDDVFSTIEMPATPSEESSAQASEISSLDDVFGTVELQATLVEEPATTLDDVFGVVELQATLVEELATKVEETAIPALDDVFGAVKVVEEPTATVKENTTPSLDDVFGGFNLPAVPATAESSSDNLNYCLLESKPFDPHVVDSHSLDVGEIVQSVEQVFNHLPPIENIAAPTAEQPAATIPATSILPIQESAGMTSAATKLSAARQKPEAPATSGAPTAQLSVRVDLERLERMNNLIGELAINRNSLALQNEQLQAIVQELLRRFARFQQISYQLRDYADHVLVAPDRHSSWMLPGVNGLTVKLNTDTVVSNPPTELGSFSQTNFDSLEMDTYGELHSIVQTTLEEMVQLEETVGDVVLVAGQSNQAIERQRQMLGHLRDDLMWARMLPLSEVLNRFPRMLRDLSNSYQKPVELQLNGTGVLVDKAVLEKLNDPLLHLVRNAFDHGIEPPDVRQQQGKPKQGLIEIRAYHQGSQTIIEVRDDGRGINLDRVRNKAVEMGLMTTEQAPLALASQLLELLFQPGFSTASQVSQLSGRGVGLDVVRAQLQSLKGSVTLNSEPGEGTTFTLRIPLTLTIAKLLVCFVGFSAFAFPSDSIAEILIPQPDQVKLTGGKRFLHWQEHIVPVYHMSQFLQYSCPQPEAQPSQALATVPTPEDWAAPILLLEHDDQLLALEIDRLVTEQELVIKPFGAAITPPSYVYGCTILGDGCLIPVIDSAGLLSSFFGETKAVSSSSAHSLASTHLQEGAASDSPTALPLPKTVPTILIVDDSITVRQTLVLTLQKADYRVLQARDGREAVTQLQQNPHIQLVISDVEMPNMNGFEFLSHRRQDPQLSKIPVVMLTSRSSEKHQRLAIHLGAKHYFTKPYIEQEFLAAVKDILIQDAATEKLAIR